MEWRYVKIGSCVFCFVENVRLRTPLIDTRVDLPPLFCRKCQAKFEALLESGVKVVEALSMTKTRT